MIIAEAGHMVMLEQPEQVNKCLRDFLFTPRPISRPEENLAASSYIAHQTQQTFVPVVCT